MRLDYQSPEALAPVIEALLFASDEPLPANTLRSLILGEEIAKLEAAQETPEAAAPVEQIANAITDGQAATGDVATETSDEGAEVDQASHRTMDPTQPSKTESDGVIEQNTASAAIEIGPDHIPVGVVPSEKKRKKKQLIELVTIHVAVQHLNSLYDQQERVFRIVEIAGGYQFATKPEYSEYVVRLSKEKSRRRLSGASLESLAIIAYKQPVSKVDVENIRGVNCDEVLKSLLEKNLITITGRAEAVGRPLLYGTTNDFLRHFGLHTLSDLPRPREIEELMKEESVRATTLEEAAYEFSPEGTTNELTVDEALAVAKELGEREEAQLLEDEQSGGIELDVDAMESMNPGHPGMHESPFVQEPDSDEEASPGMTGEDESLDVEEMEFLHEEEIELLENRTEDDSMQEEINAERMDTESQEVND
jgi:segregation and condensation protein B